MMYKTVRHGENSLQYTILPQQDDGAAVAVRPNSGRRHRKKAKTAAVLAITIVLVGGVIGTAVLVPILLTSDLVSLPAAFQKFSVATMRRTHTGNRMEIVAKKPPGWTSHHHLITSTVPSTTSTTTTTTAQPTTTTTTMATTIPTTDSPTITSESPAKDKTIFSEDETTTSRIIRPPTLPPTSRLTTALPTLQIFPTTEYHKIESDWTLPVSGKEPTKEVHKGVMILTDPGAPIPATPWYLRWTMYKDEEKLVIPIAGGAIVTLLVIILAVVWMKRRRSKRNRTVMEKMNAEIHPADKENLLTEPSGVSDEEQ